ncbi:MAG: GrpB family protein [bacterium]
MFTPDQQKVLNHLDKGNVHPFNPDSEAIFQEMKRKIASTLGADIEVLHRGSTSLGIAGQREVDIYIPVQDSQMQEVVAKLQELFGIPPKSIYESERVKFLQDANGVRVEIMVVNRDHKSWIEGEAAFKYIESHPEAKEEYEKLKIEASGLPYKEYQAKKVEFLNRILGL